MFLGYDDSSKAYHVYNPKTKKIIVTTDITFDETRFLNGTTEFFKKEFEELTAPSGSTDGSFTSNNDNVLKKNPSSDRGSARCGVVETIVDIDSTWKRC